MVMLIAHISVGKTIVLGTPGVDDVVPFVPLQRPRGEGGRTLDERRGRGSAPLGRAIIRGNPRIVCPKATSMLPKIVTFRGIVVGGTR
jgi:hypothetical protein